MRVLARNPEKSDSISSRPCPARSRREEGESAVGWGQRDSEIGRERGNADGRGPIVSKRKREGKGARWAGGNGPGRCCWFAGPKPRVQRGGAGLRLLGREKESGTRGGERSGPSAEREGFFSFFYFYFLF